MPNFIFFSCKRYISLLTYATQDNSKNTIKSKLKSEDGVEHFQWEVGAQLFVLYSFVEADNGKKSLIAFKAKEFCFIFVFFNPAVITKDRKLRS